MTTIEKAIKQQYNKVFKKKDWESFKLIADFYLKKSATLKRKDLDIDDAFKLLARNIQKRLFLGIACELLVKACYLKNGYIINTPNDRTRGQLLKFSDIKVSELNEDNTFTLNPLLDSLKNVIAFTDWKTVENGLKILKVFRNKEGHVVTLWHKYSSKNYRDIESSITSLYMEAFNEQIDFRISMEENDKGQFKIKE